MTKSKSLSFCMAEARRNGYHEVFRMCDHHLRGPDGEMYEANKIIIEDFEPVVNKLDPNKRSMIYLIQTSDNRKGMVVDPHHASSEDSFLTFISSPGEAV